MPITPFHFGLGLATKAASPRRFSLTYFILLQIVIDIESLYNLILHRYPVHRFLHTFVGATLLAVIASLLIVPILAWWKPDSRQTKFRRSIGLLATAFFATWSHVFLDGIMHRDAQPFWPFTSQNPLLSLIPLSTLHFSLIGLGIGGLIVIAFQWPSEIK